MPRLLEHVKKHPAAKKPLPYTRLFREGRIEEAGLKRVQFFKTTMNQKLAGIGEVDSTPSIKRRTKSELIEEDLIHIDASVILTTDELYGTANIEANRPSDVLLANAARVVDREMEDMIGSIYLTEEYFCAKMLQYNTVAIGPNTSDFEQKKVKLNVSYTAANGGITELAVGAKWDVAATDIINGANQLIAARKAFLAQRHRAYHAIHSIEVPAALKKNTELQKWFLNNGPMSVQFYRRATEEQAVTNGQDDDPMQRNELSGIGAIPNWHTWEHYYEDRNDAVKYFTEKERITLLPQNYKKYLGFAEGLSYVPQGTNVIGAVADADNLVVTQRGMIAYAVRVGDEPGDIKLVIRKTFKPLIRDESSVFVLKGVL
jgi:hypothetical protein